MKPLAIELFCGTFGWGAGFIAEGFDVVGFDIMDVERELGIPRTPGCQLVIQDVLTLHGSQFKDAAMLVGSSPCQEFSYRAMPWKRAKALGPPVLGMELFSAQFRIQREASEAAGRHIPLVVENVMGAQKWVGRAAWHYGFYLWGDVPALMPVRFSGHKVPGFRFDGAGGSFQSAAVNGTKTVGHVNKRDGHTHTRHLTNQAEHDGVKGAADQLGGDRRTWFDGGLTKHGSKSNARRRASALIAKIPLPLARHIARAYYPTGPP